MNCFMQYYVDWHQQVFLAQSNDIMCHADAI